MWNDSQASYSPSYGDQGGGTAGPGMNFAASSPAAAGGYPTPAGSAPAGYGGYPAGGSSGGYGAAAASLPGSYGAGAGGHTDPLTQKERTCYVNNIPAHRTEEDLTMFFSSVGHVMKSRLGGDPMRGSRFAFIEFATVDSARHARGLSGNLMFDGRALYISPAKSAISDSCKPNYMRRGGRGAPAMGGYGGAGYGAGAPAGGYGRGSGGYGGYSPYYNAYVDPRISCTIYVSGIDQRLTEKHLLEFFSVCGTVVAMKLCGDAEHPTRFAFLEFTTPAEARNALNLSGTMLAGNPLRISNSKKPIKSTHRIIANQDDDYLERCRRTVYIGNLTPEIDCEEELKAFLSTFGTVTKFVNSNGRGGASRFAFAEFETVAQTDAALTGSGAMIAGMTIKISRSKTPIMTHHLSGATGASGAGTIPPAVSSAAAEIERSLQDEVGDKRKLAQVTAQHGGDDGPVAFKLRTDTGLPDTSAVLRGIEEEDHQEVDYNSSDGQESSD